VRSTKLPSDPEGASKWLHDVAKTTCPAVAVLSDTNNSMRNHHKGGGSFYAHCVRMYQRFPYTAYEESLSMHGEKTVSIGFRVTPEFKRLLGTAARHDHRSMTNLLEKLLTDHCRSSGLLPSEAQTVLTEIPMQLAVHPTSAQSFENNE